ncbi:uncharacterized protein LOC121377845 [Gigantopelta aegis]|uniref:uncharacterized protein LOC121377845 n=1 Tax=Gigantopelta aegis TaxID=1735272 RepID=UPI001B88B47E|nr:uncharacterized protein LOC121377845 [Gigantopelta aegis]
MTSFKHIDKLIEKNEIVCEQTTEDIEGPIVLCYTSQFRPCVEFSKAKTEHESNAITITFVPKKNSYGDVKSELPSSVEINQNMEGSLWTAAAVGGSLEYKADTTGHHRTSISIDGCHIFHDRFDVRIKERDEDLVRKLLIGVDGRACEYREICLWNIEFDDWRKNRKHCEITASGLLVNTYSPKPPFNPPDSLHMFSGVTDRIHIPGLGCWYWQTDVDCTVLKKAKTNKVAAQVGVCVVGHCDDEIHISNNKHAWCVGVHSCTTHNSMCPKAVSRGTYLSDIPIASFKPNTSLNVTLGLLLDTENPTLHVVNIDTKSLVHSIPNIDTSQPVMPVFGVFNSTYFQVKLRVTSATDLSVDPALLMLLSSLVQP